MRPHKDDPADHVDAIRRHWDGYLKWAVRAFKLCVAHVGLETQIHTHMCYAEFRDILAGIAELDADVITIETSRSNMELLEAFGDFAYPNDIGPGVYDIHSPRIPTTEEMLRLLRRAAARSRGGGRDRLQPGLERLTDARKLHYDVGLLKTQGGWGSAQPAGHNR